jgi:signal transduction histidine kinase/CheY-like chemotaxis protein
MDAPTGKVTFANDRVRQIFGHAHTSEEVHSAAEHWHGRHPDGTPLGSREWPISRAILHGEVVANETVLIENAAGSQLEIVVNAAPVRNAQGIVVASVAMFWDVTSERRLERRLRDAERLQSVGTLAGGVAHEVNNQMTTVLGFGEFILRALGPEHSQAPDLRVLLKAAHRTARITHQLLTFSRQQVTQPKVVDLYALAVALRPVLQQLLGSDKELLIAAQSDARLVAADPTQVEQVLINLVANARDATETGGQVTIGVENTVLTAADSTQHGISVAEGDYALVTVSDTGAGMDETTLARVFEPFFTTKAVGEGTGLGLSMVYGILKRHGGYVWAESSPNRGTTVRLYWPATKDDQPRDDQLGARDLDPVQGHAEAPPATLLVVEDDQAVRELIVRILSAEGYQVVEAADGRSALDLMERGALKPGLVLTDVLMPRVNGRQLGDAVKAMYPDIPLLYMSGDIGENMVLRQLVPEGAPFLPKPFTPEQLLRSISSVLA